MWNTQVWSNWVWVVSEEGCALLAYEHITQPHTQRVTQAQAVQINKQDWLHWICNTLITLEKNWNTQVWSIWDWFVSKEGSALSGIQAHLVGQPHTNTVTYYHSVQTSRWDWFHCISLTHVILDHMWNTPIWSNWVWVASAEGCALLAYEHIAQPHTQRVTQAQAVQTSK